MNYKWAADFENFDVEDRVICADFTWITGTMDCTTPSDDTGWKVYLLINVFFNLLNECIACYERQF